MKKICMFAFVTILCCVGTASGSGIPTTGGPLDPIDPVNPCARICPDGYTMNKDTCECECSLQCDDGYTLNEDACTCEKRKCTNGGYHNGTACVPCPGNENKYSNSDCWYTDNGLGFRVCNISVRFCGYKSLNNGINGISDCYQESEDMLASSGDSTIVGGGEVIFKESLCKYTDDTGTYTISSDCPYSE